MARLKALNIREPTMSPGYWDPGTERTVTSKNDPNSSIIQRTGKKWVPGIDDRTILPLPKGIDRYEFARALGWFVAKGGIHPDLGAMQMVNGGVKFNCVFFPEPTGGQLAQIVHDYRLLSDHYGSWEDVFLKPGTTKGFDLMAIVLESQALLIRAILKLLPTLNPKLADELKKELPGIPEWLLTVIEIHREFSDGKR